LAGGQAITLARLGADRFAVLLEGLRTPSEAIRVAERVVREFATPFDTLKLDRTFITRLGASGMEVVAEGLEEEAKHFT